MTAVAACAVSLLLAPPAQVQAADNTPAETRPCTCPGQNDPARQVRPKFADLQANLDETDEIAALEAVRIALSEVGDGGAFVWRRENGRLSGVIKPTSSFRNVDGKICRHLIIVLAAGVRTSKIEGVACRLGNGRWELDG
jgi:17 kDa outer membrane surface antigen